MSTSPVFLQSFRKCSESLASIVMCDKHASIFIVSTVDLFPPKAVIKFTLEYCDNLPSSTKVTFIVDQSRHMIQISTSTKRSRTSFVAGLK